MVRTILWSALGAGAVVCLSLTALQLVTTEPLILHAEQFEHEMRAPAAAPEHEIGAPADVPAHEHDAEEWQPADGFERTAYTALANFVAGTAVALMLIGVMLLAGVRLDMGQGLLFGAVGFAAVSLLPSLGLPPELPGTPAADIGARQLWWAGTAFASAAGIAALAYGRALPIRLAGLALIVLPHVIGAPVPPSHEAAYPAALAGEFVAASLVASAALWLVSGLVAGWLHERLSAAAR